ncbi:MAG: hypothetical protein IKA56_02635 [Clostridia bacterium]|nr:hypothetical protein [Clostridia bacterium]
MYSKSYIKFMSVTHAQMAKAALLRQGIRSVMGRNTNPEGKQGCNYALYVDSSLIEKAHQVVTLNRIRNMGYEKGEG